MDYPILSDPDKAVAAAYGVLNESGQYARRWTFYIDSGGTIRKIDRQVNPATSGMDIIRSLEDLGFARSE